MFYLFIFLVSSSSFSEVFRDESNPNLQLCKEFKAYIERHADEPLYCGLIPDEKFADFHLPNWEPAPDGLGLRIDIQAKTVQRERTRIKYPYTISDYRKIVDQAEIESQRSIRYRVSQFDLNHDGEVERIIMRDRPSRCAEKRIGYHQMRVYGENLNLDSSFIGLSGYAKRDGQAFFYKGRVYSVSGSGNAFDVYEPTRHGDSKLISTRAICTFIRKTNS